MKQRFVVLSALLCAFGTLICGVKKFPDRIVSTDGKLVKWTADWPTDARVEFFGATKLNLEIECNLFNKVYSCKAPKRTKLEFCFKYKKPFIKKCVSLNKDRRKEEVEFGSLTAKASFDPSTGGKVMFTDVAQENQVPLVGATCTEWAESGSSVTSNQLFILDFRKNFPTETWNPSGAPVLNRNSPSTVKCLQTKLGIDEELNKSSEPFRQPAVPVTFEWFFCSDATLAKCATSKVPLRTAASFSDWPVQVRGDGELYSPFVRETAVSKLQNKRLICYVMNKPVAFYSSPVSIVNSTTSVTDLKIVRPGEEKVILYNSTDYSLTLPCLFDLPPTTFSVFWIFKDKSGDAVELKAGKTDNKLKVSVSAQSDSITLSGPFTEESEGYFMCTVRPDGFYEKRGVYEIVIKGPPRPAPEIPRTKYVVVGSNATVRCLFEDPKRITPSLSVTGKQLNLKTQKTINADKAEINDEGKKWMPPIHFSVSPVNPKMGAVLSYTESNASYDKALDSTHLVTCIAEILPFKNRARIVFKTILRPELLLTVPKVCRDTCELTAELKNGDALKKDCANVVYSWTLSKQCPSSEASPAFKGAKWKFEGAETGTKFVCGCVHLRTNDTEALNSACVLKKMELEISFWSVKNVWLWILILVLIIIVCAVIVAVFLVIKRKKEQTTQNGTNVTKEETVPLRKSGATDPGHAENV